VQEAIAQETDQTVDRLNHGVAFQEHSLRRMRRVDGTHIVVRNIPSDQVAQFRDIAHQQQYEGIWGTQPRARRTEWVSVDLASQRISAIQETTMNQSLETIEPPHQRPGPDGTHHSVARPQGTTKSSSNSPEKAIQTAPKR